MQSRKNRLQIATLAVPILSCIISFNLKLKIFVVFSLPAVARNAAGVPY